MEEIVSSDAIQSEILEDARKKAGHILEEAEAEAARNVAEIEAKAAQVVEEIVRTSEAKSARFRMETMARFPLERTRMRTVFVEAQLREAARTYIESLSEERIAALSEAMVVRAEPFLAGKVVELRRKGLPESKAREIADRALALTESVRHVEDPKLPASGLVAAAEDGSIVLKATMDLVEDSLLDRRRGELARALCGDALSFNAGEGALTL
jgi:V/A-type H+/Na+-transporting ATPase subunit E